MSDLDLHYSRFLAVRIGIIYLVSGVGGSVLSSLFVRNTISVGASGALFGLLGAMLSELFTNWTIYSNKVQRSSLPPRSVLTLRRKSFSTKPQMWLSK
jgi:membrane associated rhomboid family serine protease